MAAITIDDKARFVCAQSFELGSGELASTSNTVRRAVERQVPKEKGFIGAVVMENAEKKQLLVLSLWESGHAWSAAQYDREIGSAVAEVVEAATSYDVQTYETVTVVRA